MAKSKMAAKIRETLKIHILDPQKWNGLPHILLIVIL